MPSALLVMGRRSSAYPSMGGSNARCSSRAEVMMSTNTVVRRMCTWHGAYRSKRKDHLYYLFFCLPDMPFPISSNVADSLVNQNIIYPFSGLNVQLSRVPVGKVRRKSTWIVRRCRFLPAGCIWARKQSQCGSMMC
jgi:hypothetical protein